MRDMKLPSDAKIRGIQARKEIAAVLGALCAEWSRTEGAMAVAYGHVVGAKIGRRVECQAFEHIEAFRSKCNLLAEISSYAIRDLDVRRRFKRTIDRLRKLSSRRNTYVHGRWFVSPSNKDALFWTQRIEPQMRARAERVTAETLRSLVQEIVDVRDGLAEIFGIDLSHMQR
jgi:hypothetical protein